MAVDRMIDNALVSFSLSIRTHDKQRARKKLRVYIFKRAKDLRREAKKISREMGWSDAAGCYLALRSPDQFGVIFLWEKWIGAGYFAHELQHFINDFAEETEPDRMEPAANERIAYLAGDLTTQFWVKFYDRFEVKK